MTIDLGRFVATAVTSDVEGEIYVAGYDRESDVRKGDPSRGFTSLGPRPAVTQYSSVRALATPRDDREVVRAYAVADNGDLERFRDGAWETLVADGGSVYDTEAKITWNGPEDLFYVSPDGKRILHYDRGTLTTEPTMVDADLVSGADKLRSIASIADVGAFAGTENGIILERRDARWVKLSESVLVNQSVYAFHPFEGGVLVAGWYGHARQYYPDYGFCEEALYLGNTNAITAIVAIEGGIIVAGVETLSETERRAFAAFVSVAP